MNNFINVCPNCFAEKQIETQCPTCGYEETLSEQNPLYIKPRTILNQRYLIGNVIGHGGFGITYIGWDTTLERKVAIKEFLPTTLATRLSEMNGGYIRYTVRSTGNQEEAFKKGLEKFKQEARILAELTHENIVRVLDYFEAYNTGYIIMEYVGQEDLSQLLKRQPEKRLSVEDALGIFLPILSALKVIHAHQIYHQDISLQNIRMLEGKKPVLIDFGAARYIVGELSQSLDRIVKPGYSPLEQISNDSQKIGPWTDIYACGAVFYAMIVGELPPQSIDRLDRDDLVAPAKKNGVKVPLLVNNAVLKALSVRIGDRFQTADEFENALKNHQNNPVKLLLIGMGGILIAITIALVVVDKDNSNPPDNTESPDKPVVEVTPTPPDSDNTEKPSPVPPDKPVIEVTPTPPDSDNTEKPSPVPLDKPLLNIYFNKWQKRVTFEISEISTDLSEDDRTKLKALAEDIFKEMGYKIVVNFFSKNDQKIGSFLYLTKTEKKDHKDVVYSQPIITLSHQGTNNNSIKLYFAISLQDYSGGASAFIHKFNMALKRLNRS